MPAPPSRRTLALLKWIGERFCKQSTRLEVVLFSCALRIDRYGLIASGVAYLLIVIFRVAAHYYTFTPCELRVHAIRLQICSDHFQQRDTLFACRRDAHDTVRWLWLRLERGTTRVLCAG